MRSEHIDVAEGRISQTGHRAAVMQKLADFVPAFSHRLEPELCDGSQFAGMLFHPRSDGGVSLDRAVESQQVRSHRLIQTYPSSPLGWPSPVSSAISPALVCPWGS